MDIQTEANLQKLTQSLRSHRDIDAVKALRALVHQGIHNYNDGADPVGDKRDARVSLKACVDIVRAVQSLLPQSDPADGYKPDLEDPLRAGYDHPDPSRTSGEGPDDDDPLEGTYDHSQEYIVCVWPDYDGTNDAKAYRYFNYREAMEDADRHLHDRGFGTNPAIYVSKVLAASRLTRAIVRV